MTAMQLYSEPYQPTGGLAAVGILNQLGRPDVESLEILVREAVQNCWDARIRQRVIVEVGRNHLTADGLSLCRSMLLPSPPGLALQSKLTPGAQLLYFADFGTHGLRGPVRADHPGEERDYVDFVLNVGQPPDKELGGGSFGYGKAAFYLASGARTIIVDTLCRTGTSTYERRLICSALGENFTMPDGRRFTGRHWWGLRNPEGAFPVTGDAAASLAARLGLPDRSGDKGQGTTIAIVTPDFRAQADDGSDGADHIVPFLAESIIWNFWPRMIDTPDADRHTIRFHLTEDGRQCPIPNPRYHPRLRGFVEAMDRMRMPQGADDDLILDRPIESRRPALRLGRLVIAKGPAAPPDPPTGPQTQGARATAGGIHHAALMRAPEIVVKYLPGEVPAQGRFGYSGVFCSALPLDDAFKASEPPAHDDWVPRSVPDKQQRSHVNIALNRIRDTCREAAGFNAVGITPTNHALVPLGHFADNLAVLLPGVVGTGARRQAGKTIPSPSHTIPGSQAPPGSDLWATQTGHTQPHETDDAKQDGQTAEPASGPADPSTTAYADDTTSSSDDTTIAAPRSATLRAPETRARATPQPQTLPDGTPVISYPFELRSWGGRVRLTAQLEVMTNDGRQVETDAPLGESPPRIRSWLDPTGTRRHDASVEIGPESADGSWAVEVDLRPDVMVRVNVEAERA